jgi:predicted nucleic acid-binding protein
VYAAAGKEDELDKHVVASHIVSGGQFSISGQVLGEFYHTIRYLRHEMLPVLEAQEWMRRLQAFCAIDVDAALVNAAMFIRERFKIQFWDAALIAASQRLALPVLYSEDLSHGQKYGSVTVINPFKAR